MALFKTFRGSESELSSVPLHDGYVYYCIDTQKLFIDHKDVNDTLVRSQINAKYADGLTYSSGDSTVEVDPSDLASHTEDSTVHITSTERSTWNGKMDGPSSEGTSGQVLTTDGNGGISWSNVLSNEAKHLIMTILRAGVYTSDQTNNLTALANELGVSDITASKNGTTLTISGVEELTYVAKNDSTLIIA